MKYIGYFDINGMTPHQAISHLTAKQQDNYKVQIYAMLERNHFKVDLPHMELALVADEIYTVDARIPRMRLQYTVDMQALPAPPPSGLILPGQENGQLSQIMLRPLPDETDAP